MKSPDIFAAFALLTAAALATTAFAEFTYVPGEWPPVKNAAKQKVALLPDTMQRIDLSRVPDIPVNPAVPREPCPTQGNFGPNGTCWWSCGRGIGNVSKCLRDSDVSTCTPGKFALTFDDGPSSNRSVGNILDVLKQNNVTATFCLLAPNIVRHPDLAKRVRDEGHNLCFRSWSNWPAANLTNEELISDMKWSDLAFQRVLGIVPKYYRPPHGSLDDRVRKVVELLGYTPLMWDMSTRDTRILGSTVAGEATFEEVWSDFQKQLETASSNKGTIFLQHDTFMHAIEYLSLIIPAVRQRQLKFATVAECVGDTMSIQRISDFNVTSNWKKDFGGRGTGETSAEKSAGVEENQGAATGGHVTAATTVVVSMLSMGVMLF